MKRILRGRQSDRLVRMTWAVAMHVIHLTSEISICSVRRSKGRLAVIPDFLWRELSIVPKIEGIQRFIRKFEILDRIISFYIRLSLCIVENQ